MWNPFRLMDGATLSSSGFTLPTFDYRDEYSNGCVHFIVPSVILQSMIVGKEHHHTNSVLALF